jgi:tetratricopeptide (TPR) repeat protein
MKTLYELLEALPDDDADGLRAAFRKAAKANHPDFNPGNEEASERFRRIVRANAILSDGQQRAEYDRLLEIARRQQNQQPKPKRGFLARTIRRLAADAVTSAVVSVVLIGGYFAYRSADRLPLASAQVVEMAKSEPAQAVTVQAAEIADTSSQAEQRATPASQHTEPDSIEASNTAPDVTPQVADEPAKPDNSAVVATTEVASADAYAPPSSDYETRDVKFYRERGMRAYRNGDLYLALANFDLAIDLDPGLPESYIDRGIVFHRLGDLKRAFSDVAEAKRIEAVNRNKTPSVASAP